MMPKPSTFTIFDASAGSGKTFTLVKEYLKIVLASNSDFLFKQILAITFTNKAVAEMKTRIIKYLKLFSEEAVLEGSDAMFSQIAKELDLEPEVLHQKSKRILNNIIHNYGSFDISTIDGFTHKLIRTFAHDLKLPMNFEVELDQESFLQQAVDSLINKAGTNKQLTQVLVDFAIEKADDDKSWDVAYDFNKVAKLLVNENDIPHVEQLRSKTVDDFMALKKQIRSELKVLEEQAIARARAVLTLIDEAGLDFSDFNRGSLPRHFEKLASRDFYSLKFDAPWQQDIENGTLYPKRVEAAIAETIDAIQPELVAAFEDTKKAILHLKFLNNFYKNITPLSVLNTINKELEALKLEQNKMLISEFNTIISKEIKDQPTPFIYERLGEKFKHYFIDEFQDTSVKQWQNLIPLLDNSLASEKGSAVLVGDAKQAIYRWRGGKAEQFIGLNAHENPFVAVPDRKHLPSNFRSSEAIVTFNNGLFKYVADEVFNHSEYSALYQKSKQENENEHGGFVSLSFLDLAQDEDRDMAYCAKTLETIQNCVDQGYVFGDICVLVRKKKEGVAVAQFLSENDIPIMSSETLLLKNSFEVQLIINVLQLLTEPKNNEVKIEVLNGLTKLFSLEDKHAFFTAHLDLPLAELFKALEKFDISLNSDALVQLPFYDLVETLIRGFGLTAKPNAYLQFFLDVVLEFSQKRGSDMAEFLNYFETNKDKLSIVSPVGQNAVQIMTIHKSKGLEFPVVILPYADLDIYREIDPKLWFHINPEMYQGFSETLLNFSKDFEYFGTEGEQLFNQHRGELELDNINLLYVALTRPVDQLYVISKMDVNSKGEVNTNKYSGILISYLMHLGLWEANKEAYSFGSLKGPQHISEAAKTDTLIPEQFISTPKEDHNIRVVTKSGYLWDTKQKQAIEKGNLIHDIMAFVYTPKDIDLVLQDFLERGMLQEDQVPIIKSQIKDITEHPQIEPYFKDGYMIYNERDIITRDGLVYRPDRVVLNAIKEVVIIDYKTGLENRKHAQQLQLYQDVLETMNLKVTKKILVYTNDAIIVKEV
ncbi:UvrD-helicase domain-containing protein [Gaetbulibacter sp. M240]|uniref:UvrD-helicase domain-containing protein n=1 Tax=Gaetbulibacter sp. M240 TaxID=3126511 RepID=UPI00374F7468